jgi:hypothetical protein
MAQARALQALIYRWNHACLPKMPLRTTALMLAALHREGYPNTAEFENEQRIRRQRELGSHDAAADAAMQASRQARHFGPPTGPQPHQDDHDALLDYDQEALMMLGEYDGPTTVAAPAPAPTRTKFGGGGSVPVATTVAGAFIPAGFDAGFDAGVTAPAITPLAANAPTETDGAAVGARAGGAAAESVKAGATQALAAHAISTLVDADDVLRQAAVVHHVGGGDTDNGASAGYGNSAVDATATIDVSADGGEAFEEEEAPPHVAALQFAPEPIMFEMDAQAMDALMADMPPDDDYM